MVRKRMKRMIKKHGMGNKHWIKEEVKVQKR
jgi:hypothetical protein